MKLFPKPEFFIEHFVLNGRDYYKVHSSKYVASAPLDISSFPVFKQYSSFVIFISKEEYLKASLLYIPDIKKNPFNLYLIYRF